jgi:hypothetical protein
MWSTFRTTLVCIGVYNACVCVCVCVYAILFVTRFIALHPPPTHPHYTTLRQHPPPTTHYPPLDLTGMRYLSVDRQSFLAVQYVVSMLKSAFPQTREVGMLYRDKVIWSGIDQVRLRESACVRVSV